MTISKLAQLNKANDGHFFDRKTMKGNGETLRSFKAEPHSNGITLVTRIRDGRQYKFTNADGRIHWGQGAKV